MEVLDRKLKILKGINKTIDAIIIFSAIIVIGVAGWVIWDNNRFIQHGIASVEYLDFDELSKINPDVCGWIRMDGTHIDNPVVHTNDNQKYLEIDFYGNPYAGGTLFLDCNNKKDFSDQRNMIHGHEMAGGAMFGDLLLYKDKSFFAKNSTGTLLTPEYDYKLTVLSVAVVDAYDSVVYDPKGEKGKTLEYLKGRSICSRNVGMNNDKLLILSTCSGEMNDNRVVVCCKMGERQKHDSENNE